MTIHTSQASTHDIVVNSHRSYPPHYNTRRILRFQSLLLLNNLILQSRIFISQPMFLSIYFQISNLPRNNSTESKRELTKPLNLRPQCNKRTLQHLAVPQQLHVTLLPPIKIQRRARLEQRRIDRGEDMIHMFRCLDQILGLRSVVLETNGAALTELVRRHTIPVCQYQCPKCGPKRDDIIFPGSFARVDKILEMVEES